MKVFVIIVTYNGMKWVDWCLQSLRQSTVPLIPVVVDNCSTDGTREHIPASYPEVVWMPQERNLGFGQGNNLGMKYALEQGGDYVLLLNQDAALHPDAVEKMLQVADGRSLVTPVHLCGDGSRIDYMFRESLKRASNELIDDLLLRKTEGASYEIGEVCAACWFMPISMVKEVGGFNPLFFQYGEDNNYYTRLVFHKRKVILAPQARMCHDRKLHGNTALFNKKRLRILTLVVACDPCLSFMERAKKITFLWIKHPLAEVGELVNLLGKCGKIRESRKQEKQLNQTWL